MNLKKDLMDIKKKRAFDRCFKKEFFDVCPINDLHWPYSYPNRSLLVMAHCIHFNEMTEGMISDLKRLAKEAIDYKAPWWKIF